MQQILYTLLGVAITLTLYGLISAIMRTWKLAVETKAALAGIPRLIESNQRVANQLEILVGILTGTPPNFGVDTQVEGGEESEAPRPTRVPMPVRPMGSYRAYEPEAPDATEDDTEIYDTSDAELVEAEQLEEVRARGYSVEADEEPNPPGIVKQV